MPLEAGFSLPARENLLRAQRQSLCLVKSFQSWGPLLSPLTHIQGRGLAFPSLGWQIVNLGLSRKYSDIKVIRSPADKTDNSQQSGSFHLLLVSSLCSALSFNLFFFFLKKTFLETLITVEGCCKVGREIDHFYSAVRDKM